MIGDEDDDEKLISFDTSAVEDSEQPGDRAEDRIEDKQDFLESKAPSNEEDLLGILNGPTNEQANANGLYGEFESSDSAKESRGRTLLFSLCAIFASRGAEEEQMLTADRYGIVEYKNIMFYYN